MIKNNLDTLMISPTGNLILPSPNEPVAFAGSLLCQNLHFIESWIKHFMPAVAVTFLSDHSLVIQKTSIFVRF